MPVLESIKITVKNFNQVAKDENLMKRLRVLTLNPFSGLNYELDNLEKISQNREAQAKVIMAHFYGQLIAWALLSREYSKFIFPSGNSGFKPENGSFFQVYVHPKYRRNGIATYLFKEASKNANSHKIGLSPWNNISKSFFDKIKDNTTFYL